MASFYELCFTAPWEQAAVRHGALLWQNVGPGKGMVVHV